jgi:mRNA interferase MazF
MVQPQRGEIYLTELSGHVGSEQYGIRPALVVQNDTGNTYSPTTIIVPFTSKQKPTLPTHLVLSPLDCGILQESTVLCEQVRAIDKTRLMRKLGQLKNRAKLSELNQKLMIAFGVTG